MKKLQKNKKVILNHTWNLGLLYASAKDPQIEKDIVAFEKKVADFVRTYDTPQKTYLSDENVLHASLKAYATIVGEADFAAVLYFCYLRDIEADNQYAQAQMALMENRLAHISNSISFFEITLGTISSEMKRQFVSSPRLADFKVFLSRVFEDAKYTLSVAEEKIMNLKSLPAHSMWISANERILNMKTVVWKKKVIPVSEALFMISSLPTSSERKSLATAIVVVLKTVASFTEAEINAVYTNKKINDGIRGYVTPAEETIHRYRNDPRVIETLVKTVTDNFKVAHSFYALKAKLLKQKKLLYSDRGAGIGRITTEFSFEQSAELLKKTFGSIDPKFRAILERFMAQGQIDAFPRVGKRGGAYCSGSYPNPTFVMLNHTNDLRSFTTFAHEMGHAFHTELSRIQGPLYMNYSTSLAETASTLFEAIALDAVFETLSDKEKILVLHDKINDDVATVFRQIACFNFENDLHSAIRSKGSVSQAEIAELLNRNMKAYLGPVFDMKDDDGYYFVHWSHIRQFFYVYTYAYGQLVSKALLRRYRADNTFWSSIEKFLSAGGKDSPENILKEIGIDVYSPGFWKEGLQEIADDIQKLEQLTKKKK